MKENKNAFLGQLASVLKPTSDAQAGSQLAGFQQWSAQTHGNPDEFRVFMDLMHRGMSPGGDFKFQSDRLGGLSHIGDAKIQFFIPGPKIILRVQGIMWAKEPLKQHSNDIIQKLMWIGRGWFVADLLSDEIQANVHRVVSLALQYQNTPAADRVLK